MRDVAAVILAAGSGTRLRPLTAEVPKALCPIGNVPLLDRALDRLDRAGFHGPGQVAVNACHLASQVVSHLDGRAHASVETGSALGTAGALGLLRPWIDGRGVLVGNADAYLHSPTAAPGEDLASLLDGWDGHTVRLLGVPAAEGDLYPFGDHVFAGFSLLPWSDVSTLAARLSHLVLTTWRPAEREGRLRVIEYSGTYLDTGTPEDYLAANVHAASVCQNRTSSGALVARTAAVSAPVRESVIGDGARVSGPVTRSVVWPGGVVGPEERLTDAIRVGAGLTVHARSSTVGVV